MRYPRSAVALENSLEIFPSESTPLARESWSYTQLFKWIFEQCSTFAHNLPTLTTYWVSIDNWAAHMGWIAVAVSTHFADNKWMLPPLLLFGFGEFCLAVNTQCTIPAKLRKLPLLRCLSDAKMPFGTNSDFKSQRWKNFSCALSIITKLSNAWKAIVTASSFSALTKDIIIWLGLVNSLSNNLLAGLLGLIVMVPIFYAQQLNYSSEEELPFRSSLKKHPHSSAWTLAGLFTLANTALYFNTFNKVFVPWLQKNLTALLPSPLGIALVALNAFCSTSYFYATIICYQKSLLDKILKDPGEQCSVTYHLYPRGRFAALWKTIVSSLALILIFHNTGYTEVGYAIAALCFVGNELVQESFYTETEANPAPETESSCCHKIMGFFCNKRRSQDPEQHLETTLQETVQETVLEEAVLQMA